MPWQSGGTILAIYLAMACGFVCLWPGLIQRQSQQFGQGAKVLEWQVGYGVVSFGTKDLPWVKLYIQHQKEHHAKAFVHDRLERITDLESDEPPPR